MSELSIIDPSSPDARALIANHLAYSVQHSVDPDDDHALDADGLADPSITLYGLRDPDGHLVAIAALRRHDAQLAELKAMHIAADRRGSGLGRRVLDQILAAARDRGYLRVSLETGTQDGFAPARTLYRRAGFIECEPFADYRSSPNSVFMTRPLTG